jgi:hypothetical protein
MSAAMLVSLHLLARFVANRKTPFVTTLSNVTG